MWYNDNVEEEEEGVFTRRIVWSSNFVVKKNCWEYKNCGRIPGGADEKELGICPVYTHCGPGSEANHGVCAGRICWAVAGTFCDGKVQGVFAQKLTNCMACDFYKHVRDEESPCFKMLPQKEIIEKKK